MTQLCCSTVVPYIKRNIGNNENPLLEEWVHEQKQVGRWEEKCGFETNIRLRVLNDEKCHKIKNPFKNNSESKSENVFKLFVLPKMKVKPARDCIQKTEEESNREKCRRFLTITTIRNTTFMRCLVLH